MHSGDDLGETYKHAKGQLSDGLRGKMEEVWANFNNWDTLRQIERVTDLRRNMHPHFVKTAECLFYDNALESYVRQLTEKIMHVQIETRHLFGEILNVLYNLALSYPSQELAILIASWEKLIMPVKDVILSNKDVALKAKSVIDRL